jgi:hypothetical protein
MKKEWQTFVRRYDDLEEGEMTLFIKDLTPGPRKYDTKHVRAVVKKRKQSLPNGETLYIRSESGERATKPWSIKILEELPPWVPGRPWEDVFEALKKSDEGDNR